MSAVNKKKEFVGERIRKIRKGLSLTQAELAQKIGIIQSDLCRMERGEYKVGLDILFKILQVFNMDIAEFFYEERIATERTPDAAELVHVYNRLSEASRREVVEFIRFKEEQEKLKENSKKKENTTP